MPLSFDSYDMMMPMMLMLPSVFFQMPSLTIFRYAPSFSMSAVIFRFDYQRLIASMPVYAAASTMRAR